MELLDARQLGGALRVSFRYDTGGGPEQLVSTDASPRRRAKYSHLGCGAVEDLSSESPSGSGRLQSKRTPDPVTLSMP